MECWDCVYGAWCHISSSIGGIPRYAKCNIAFNFQKDAFLVLVFHSIRMVSTFCGSHVYASALLVIQILPSKIDNWIDHQFVLSAY
jgi:hypothetical protein